MRFSDGLKTIERSTQPKGVAALFAGDDVCLPFICMCVCLEPLAQLEQSVLDRCIPAGEHTLSDLSTAS